MGLQKNIIEIKSSISAEQLDKAWKVYQNKGTVCITDPECTEILNLANIAANSPQSIIEINCGISLEQLRKKLINGDFNKYPIMNSELGFKMLAEMGVGSLKDKDSASIYFTGQLPIGYSMAVTFCKKYCMVIGTAQVKI